ncbi:MAG: type I DNA topoisomerase [Firmicutes bacterium HGW-Firmicutes-1]|jgi:DNA topoisomerase-1|nr:MAG: type I DNA topoisomerase [Firmicutes bacterium HGW-Firmicutes-1]
MAKNLVIVESPAKAKTIKKFLGANYKIEASMGHVRDLPKSQMGIDIENDFDPKYITIRGKGELLATLRKEVKKASKVYLATDPDREGEAISWHLMHALNLEGKTTYRITFNEITKSAIQNSIKNAREIDMDLVDAQQARRILDRIVGYKISPLLWKKVKKGLSAGRVQSVALKIICDREEEINAFIPVEYWTLDAILKDKTSKDEFKAHFYGIGDKKKALSSIEEVQEIEKAIKGKNCTISDIKEKERIRKPLPPFITSTMQQEGSKKLNFSTSKTMRIAQQLYEGIEIKDKGTIGLITYLRTDSTRIADEAHESAIGYISDKYGSDMANPINTATDKKRKVQDAHEAIRPTYVELEPEQIKDSLSKEQFKLYKLIWCRYVASRMMPAKYNVKSVKVDIDIYRFTAALSVLTFDGFLKVYKIDDQEEGQNEGDDEDDQKITNINIDSSLKLVEIDDKQHFTQPPARFTEASLVKTLEENGVGRPSTYAPTITTILARNYISKEAKQLFPTELGEIVSEILVEYFSEIVDVGFTASLEEQLDHVEEGDMEWKNVIRKFYPHFSETVDKAEVEIGKIEIKDEVSDVLCDKCGRNMVIKIGKFGKFLACPGFPECRNAKPIFEKIDDVLCPNCGADILVKKTKKGRRYYGCESGDFMTWNKPTSEKCNICGSIMIEKGKNLMCINEDCKNVVSKV